MSWKKWLAISASIPIALVTFFILAPMWAITSVLVIISVPVLGWIFANFNIFFTFMNEGEVKVVMKGGKDLGGEFVDFLFRFKGWRMLRTLEEVEKYRGREKAKPQEQRLSNYTDDYLDNHLQIWEVVPLEEGEKDPETAIWGLNKLFLLFGYQWFGFSPLYRIASWEFSWGTAKISKDPNRPGQTEPKNYTQRISSIFLKQSPYYSQIVGVYTNVKENIRINLGYILGLSCRNPYKALFRQNRWLDGLTVITDQQATSFVLTKVFGEIQAGKTDEFSAYMDETRGRAIEDFGHQLDYCRILTKIPHDETAQGLVNASANMELARRNGEALKTTAAAASEAEKSRASGIEAVETAQVADELILLRAKENFAAKLQKTAVKGDSGQEALKTLVALTLAGNPATKTLVIGGDGQGTTAAVAGLASAIIGQMSQTQGGTNVPAPTLSATTTPTTATIQP